jgi:hypothetical protein
LSFVELLFPWVVANFCNFKLIHNLIKLNISLRHKTTKFGQSYFFTVFEVVRRGVEWRKGCEHFHSNALPVIVRCHRSHLIIQRNHIHSAWIILWNGSSQQIALFPLAIKLKTHHPWVFFEHALHEGLKQKHCWLGVQHLIILLTP